MQITKAEVVRLKVPFTDGGKGEGLFINRWNSLDFVLLRLETDGGLVGWGEAFSYFCAGSVAALLTDTVAPALIGRDPRDPGPILDELKQRLHIIGRYGITMFAISGADMALHDLAAKAAGVPLGAFIGARRRETVPAYASLVRYADDDIVKATVDRALGEGYGVLKLHEIALDHIRAGRDAAGPGVPITNDVNCNWTVAQTEEWAETLKEIDLFWLEEPIWPPEGFAEMAQLRKTGIPIASGENACTHYQFADMIAKGAVDYAQPSVTKVGGVAEALASRTLAEEAGVKIAMHSPYFGPGYLATLQLLSTGKDEELFEYLYIDREGCLYRDLPVPEQGRVAIPDGPGLGMDPDPEMLAKYRV